MSVRDPHHHHPHPHPHPHHSGDHPDDHSRKDVISRLKAIFFHSHHQDRYPDRAMEDDARGIWALKVSLFGLSLTSFVQMVVVGFSGSIALFSDAIHNIADALTTIPLWIAFFLIRRGANSRFTHGYGKTEDLAGLIVVLIILSSAMIAVGESFFRFLSPRPMLHPGWVAAASVIGFLGNEIVAHFRIRIGEEIGSTTLVADGQHSRVDGLASLLVLVGAFGQWIGFPILDPIVGIFIGILILSIVWTSGKSIFFRMVDAIEPEYVEKIRAVALHSKGVLSVRRLRVRWVGHRIVSEVDVEVDPELSLKDAVEIEKTLENMLHDEIDYLGAATVRAILHRHPASPS